MKRRFRQTASALKSFAESHVEGHESESGRTETSFLGHLRARRAEKQCKRATWWLGIAWMSEVTNMQDSIPCGSKRAKKVSFCSIIRPRG